MDQGPDGPPRAKAARTGQKDDTLPGIGDHRGMRLRQLSFVLLACLVFGSLGAAAYGALDPVAGREPTTAPSAAAARQVPLILIDAGHGGTNTGAPSGQVAEFFVNERQQARSRTPITAVGGLHVHLNRQPASDSGKSCSCETDRAYLGRPSFSSENVPRPQRRSLSSTATSCCRSFRVPGNHNSGKNRGTEPPRKPREHTRATQLMQPPWALSGGQRPRISRSPPKRAPNAKFSGRTFRREPAHR